MPVRLVGVPWDATTLGRKGARLAPEALRRELARLHPFDAEGLRPISWLTGKDLALSEEHADLLRAVGRTAEQGAKLDPEAPLVLLGGDHAVAYAGVGALHRRYPDLEVVSLDAHLDLRGPEGGPSNGNWALRMMETFDCPYRVLGVGRFSNGPELFDRARERGVRWVSAETVRRLGPERSLKELGVPQLRGKDVYLTLDVDVIDQAAAPGASSPAPDGLSPLQVRELLHRICASTRVRGFDLCEVNPTVDPSGITARLAAHLLLAFLSTTGT
ncbi:MAG: arginase family protein [Euryarchaeota archaeon]|nr:arginase family protein [Euryarchaeota archaeon]MDE1836457.1 arginase family protein [Euryarchaeota archaeon]MDE1879028.1 arginase family protein [Euryarchaeota archaeon]MDE2044205.1 arginase family protein [Thermoplasmata archaeon]